MRKTVALIDYDWGGHHETVMHNYILGAVNAEMQVVVCCKNSSAIQGWVDTELSAEQRQLVLGTIEIEQFSAPKFSLPVLKQFRINQAKWTHIGKQVQKLEQQFEVKVDLVYLALIKELINPVPRGLAAQLFTNFPYQWAGMSFLIHQYYWKTARKTPLHGRVEDILNLDNCVGITILDELLVNKANGLLHSPKIHFIPDATAHEEDPKATADLVDSITKFAAGRKVVSLVGSITYRKGWHDLVKLAKDKKFDGVVLLAGKMKKDLPKQEDEWIWEFLDSKPNNVMLIDRYLDSVEIPAITKISDAVYLVYKNFPQSSGVMTVAAQYKVPVVASNFYLLGSRTTEYKIGEVADENSLDSIESALNKVFRNGKEYYRKGLEEFAEAFSVDNFINEFAKFLIKSTHNKELESGRI